MNEPSPTHIEDHQERRSNADELQVTYGAEPIVMAPTDEYLSYHAKQIDYFDQSMIEHRSFVAKSFGAKWRGIKW